MVEQNVIPRKERERLARREEIQRAARAVFAEKGFEAATLEEIAERSELAKGTIYGYFENKEALFFSLIEEILEGQARIIKEAHEMDKTAPEKLCQVVRRYVTYLAERHDLFRILMGQSGGLTGNIRDEIRQKYFQVHRHHLDHLVAILEEGARGGELKALPANAMAYVIVGLIHGAMIPLVITQDLRDEEQVIQTITEVLLHGVAK
jgi:AcrR family transcriptional regulator